MEQNKIIHQIFLKISSKTMKDFDYDQNQELWKLWCEDNGFKYMFHDEETMENIMTEKDREMKQRIIDEDRHPFCLIDWSKYIIVNHYGGYYVDLDVVPIDTSIDFFRRHLPLIVGYNNYDPTKEINKGISMSNNNFFGYEKGKLRDLLNHCYGEYEWKSKKKGYDIRKIRFMLQVAGPGSYNRWVNKNKLEIQKDFDDYFLDHRTVSWTKIKKKDLIDLKK